MDAYMKEIEKKNKMDGVGIVTWSYGKIYDGGFKFD